MRVVPPQKVPAPPDQLSTSLNQEVIWPYDNAADHNAGFSSRSVTIIKVLPLPEGTTDINVMEAGWNYVDQNKIIVYGAIDGTDSNGNGILDSEEGTPDPDPKTARVRQANGAERIVINTSEGALKKVEAVNHDDPAVPQTGKPATTFPYGVTKFEITGLASGASVTLTLVYPGAVPASSGYYKISPTGGWQPVPFGSNDGDNTITLTLTDGNPLTDADGVANGTIVDPGALATTSAITDPGTTPTTVASSGGGGCFTGVISGQSLASTATAGIILGLIALIVAFAGFRRQWKK
jgi:hypothetical protein